MLQNVLAVQQGIMILTGLMTPMVNAARDWNESFSKTNTILGEHANVLTEAAATSARTMGLSGNQLLKYGSEYANLFRAMKLTEEQSANMSLATVQLASDISSFNNIPMDDALGKLKSALVGEYLPMRAVGAQLNEIIVAEEGLRLGLAETKKELTAQDKVMARFSVIVGQLDLTIGDFARTQWGLANQQRVATAAMDDMQRKAGQALLPVFLSLTQASIGMMEVILPLIVALGTQFPAVLIGVTAAYFFYASGATTAAAATAMFLTTLRGVLTTFLPMIAVGLAVFAAFALLDSQFHIVTIAFEVLGAAAKFVGDILRDSIVWVIDQLKNSPLPAVLALISVGFNVMGSIVGAITSKISEMSSGFNILGAIASVVGTIIKTAFDILLFPINLVVNGITWLLELLGVELPPELKAMTESIKGGFGDASDAVSKFGSEAEATAFATETAARDIIGRAIPGMEGVASDFFSTLPDAADRASESTLKRTSSIMAGIASSLSQGKNEVKDAIANLKKAMDEAMNPKKESKQLNKFLDSKKLKEALKSQDAAVRAAAMEAEQKAKERLFALENNVADLALESGMTYDQAYGEAAKTLTDKLFAEQAARDKEIANKQRDNWHHYGGATMDAYMQGMRDMAPEMRDHLEQLLRDLVPIIEAHSPPGFKSPLHNIKDWGKGTMGAFGDGMVSAGEGLRQSANAAISAVRPVFGGAPQLAIENAGAGRGVVINNNFQPGSVRKDEDIRRITERIHMQARLRGSIHNGGSASIAQ